LATAAPAQLPRRLAPPAFHAAVLAAVAIRRPRFGLTRRRCPGFDRADAVAGPGWSVRFRHWDATGRGVYVPDRLPGRPVWRLHQDIRGARRISSAPSGVGPP